MTYYIKGGSRFEGDPPANPTVWVALNLASFPDSKYLDVNWKQIDYENIIDSQDPFWLFGSVSGGAKEAEFGLYNNYRIKITTSGIFRWVGPGDDDFDPLGGGSDNLGDLDDVVISTPADNELLVWDNGSSKWINQTAAEAGIVKYTDAEAQSAVTFGHVNSGTDFNSHSEQVKAGFHLAGGGTITVDGSYRVGWTQRMIVINVGRGTHFSTDGFFDIDQPTSGTITAVGGGTANTWTASGIIIPNWESLYYILPIGSDKTSIDANFRMVGYQSSDLEIPDDWILIAKHLADAAYIKFGVGIQLNASETWVQGTASMIKYTNAQAVSAVNAAGLALAATKRITSADEDLTFTFGRAQIDSRFADYMAISHRDMSGNTEWALAQHKLGDTFLNAPTGKALNFNINNVYKMSMSASGLTMGIPIAMGTNKITGLTPGAVSGEAVEYDQLHAKQHAMDSATYHTSSDVATLDASTTKHGFLKKLDNTATNFMNGQGNWAVPGGGGGDDLGNHIATEDLQMGSNDITFTAGSFEYSETIPTGTTNMSWNGYFYATRVYNAVYNDYADYWRAKPGVYKKPGYCYSLNKKGLIITNKRADKACMGICSDTYGFATGQQYRSIPISIGGFLLAHVNKEYKTGTLLVPNKNGILTKARFYEKRRVVAKYMFKETKIKTRGIKVNGRSWVKVL